MSKDVCHHIDVTGGTIEVGAIGASKFVRRDFFERCGNLSILFDKVFHCAH